MLYNREQLLKVYGIIAVTPSGIITLSKLEQFPNA